MRSKPISFITIRKDISDSELIKVIKQYPDSPIWGFKEFVERVNVLKSKMEGWFDNNLRKGERYES